MRRAFFAANWKMFKTSQEAEVFLNALLANPLPDCDLVLCPPLLSIPALSGPLAQETRVGLGAQNLHEAEEGAYTGEVAPRMLDEFGVKYVIIGHSERRAYFNDTDDRVNLKVKTALKWGFTPILCCGENLEEREIGVTLEKVAMQLKKGLEGLSAEEIDRIVVAYEPIWAIGTGRNASAADAVEVIDGIRKVLNVVSGVNAGETVRVLYGGSVKPENAAEYMAHRTIDGALIGGASLKPESFKAIAENGLKARLG